MSDNKKYYYLKLKDNFFDREEIKVIKGMEKGDSYVCIMLEMYLRSLKRDGLLMMTDRIPYNLQTLSSVLGRPQDEIKYAIELFTEFRLIDVLATGEMYMSDIQNFIGQSSTEGDRKREYRKQIESQKDGQMSGQKSLPPSKKPKNGKKGQTSGQMSDKQPPEIELEKELELELEKKKDVFIFDNWRKEFSVYQKYTESGFKEAMNDKQFVDDLTELFDTVDIMKTVRNAYKTYWMTEDGWKQKKKKRSKKIDFKETIRNILRMGYNNVYKGKPSYTQQNMFQDEHRPESKILNSSRG